MFETMYARPAGPWGVLGGQLMAARGGDVNRWAIDLLRLRPIDHLLEVGTGPGKGLEAAADRLIAGRAVGVDPSPVMVAQATRRNRSAISEGHVEVVEASADALPFADQEFTCAVSVDAIQFWPSVEAGLWEIQRVLEPGGRLVVAVRARRESRNPLEFGRRGYTRAMVDDLEARLVSVGFRFMRREVLRRPGSTTVALVVEALRAQNQLDTEP